MALGFGMSCVKYLLFCFNLLFAITGLIILIVGIKAEISSHPYIDLTDSNFYTSAPVVLIIVGIVVFIVAFFGCCGAVKENHCMIVTFSVFLLVIFVAELAVGIAGYVKHQDLETGIVRHLNATIKEYPTNPAVRDTFDIMQTDFSCCGINGPADWANVTTDLPDSCCGAREIAPGTGLAGACKPGSPTVHSGGCLPKLVSHMQEIAYVLGGVGLGVAFVQELKEEPLCSVDSHQQLQGGCVTIVQALDHKTAVFFMYGGIVLGTALVQLLGVIFACCLARSIRSQYETV